MRELLRRLRHWLGRGQFESELEEEMRHHLALSAEQRGSADAASRQFGNITLLREESRGMWTWTVWEQFLQDLRYGLRTMAANPLFTAIAVISLALGIGANTAIFSFMDAILLRTLPVKNPSELVVFHWRSKTEPGVIHSMTGSMFNDSGTGRTVRIFRSRLFRCCARIRTSCPRCSPTQTLRRLNIVAQNQAEFAEGTVYLGRILYRPGRDAFSGPIDRR